MSDLMAPFREVVEDPHKWIRKFKADTGRRVAGYFCDYVPEEILWAGGFVPIRITGGKGNVVAADKYLQSNVCSFARRCFDQALEGVFEYLDGLVVPHTCDVITKLYDLWAYRMNGPEFLHYIWVPHKVFEEGSITLMHEELKRLQKCVEEHTGSAITDEALAETIKLYNRSRSLLKGVYELRKSAPPAISGADAYAVALSSVLTPKDVHIQWMEDLLAAYEGKEPALDERPRILISASILDNLDLVRAVEDAGAWVVADDACTGSRYFFDEVDESDGNPLEALTHRYLNKLPCPRSVGSLAPRSDHLHALAGDYHADGIVFHIFRCCDAHLFQYPMLNERLQKAGYRVLYLQGDQAIGINEAMKNRIKAFTEMLSS